jgi:hypothetical protein
MEEDDLTLQKRKEYLDDRRVFEDRKYINQQNFDKTILTISTLALGFSLTLIKDTNAVVNYEPGILIVSWSCFVVSMLSILISYLTASKAFENHIKLRDEYYETDKYPTESKNRANKFTLILNYTALSSLLLGIVFLLIFVLKNIK